MTKNILKGKVIRNNGKKTVIVQVLIKKTHKRYKKTICFKKNYMVNDTLNSKIDIGDNVIIIKTKPISKYKHWQIKTSLNIKWFKLIVF